jgi:tetratricopeptide (TPR) repeat protein
VVELRRLLTVHRAYQHMNAGDVAVEHEDLELAMAEYGTAAELLPDNLEVQYWAAVTLATNGKLEQALPIFREVFAADPNWVELTRRLHKPGMIPDTPEGRALVEKILAAAD